VVSGFFVAFGVIFAAEMGDKSQLMALAFATRYRPLLVLIGITIATAITHLISVGIGDLLATHVPTRAVTIVAGVAFLAFAAWTWRGDELSAEEEAAAARERDRRPLAAIGAIGVTFFLAELGDKTMLATITLAAREGLFATWLGSTVGMVVADGLAIVVGRQLGTRLPAHAVKIAATGLFVFFGLGLIVEGIVR